jgi:hypothetical protein
MTTTGQGDFDPTVPTGDAAPVSQAAGPITEDDPDSGVGRHFVSPTGVVVLGSIILMAMLAGIYALVAVWPTSAVATTTSSRVAGVSLLLDREQRLFVVVAIAGALGGLIHSARSLYEYVGNRMLRRSWLLMYASLPFIGAALAVVFYVILRGGLITGTAAQVNVFGFAAVAALVGLFSPEAAEKLKQIFSTLLAPVHEGRDRLESKERVGNDRRPL